MTISPQKTESSIIQTFVLPPGERLIAMFQHSETVDSIIIEDTTDRSQTPTGSGVSHTVDGMILVTTSGVFQCQPRTSPEKLFLELAVSSSDTSAADVLAITSGLDVNKLYEVGTCMSFIHSLGSQPKIIKFWEIANMAFSDPKKVCSDLRPSD